MRNRRLRALRKRKSNTEAFDGLSHAELARRARELGCPPFCNGWLRETLIRKVQEREDAR